MIWKTFSRREVYRNRYMTVTQDEVMTGFGDRLTFGIVHKEPGVIIIPWDGKHTTLVGQYRYAVNTFSWEWPAGHFEHHSIEDTARTELSEETGLVAGKLTKLGEYFVAPGHMTQICHIYLATDLSQGQRHLEPAEKGMQLKSVTILKVKAMIRTGEIKDGLTIVALKFLELHLEQS